MTDILLKSGFRPFSFGSTFFWIMMIISILNSVIVAKKRKQQSASAEPKMRNAHPRKIKRTEWDAAKMEQQRKEYLDENSYSGEAEFQKKSDVFQSYIPREEFTDAFEVEMPEEHVPEEMGENNYGKRSDSFYSRSDIQNALQDEEDIARELAYAREKKASKSTSSRRIRKDNLRQAILYSEILGVPKSLRQDDGFRA